MVERHRNVLGGLERIADAIPSRSRAAGRSIVRITIR